MKTPLHCLPAKGSSLLAVLALALASATSAHAVTYYSWVDSSLTPDNWSVAGNWNPATVPNSATAAAVFDGAGDTGAITLGGNAYQLDFLQFGNGETTGSSIPAYTIGSASGDKLEFATTSASAGVPTGFIEDTGSVNTAAETIDAAVVLNYGYSSTSTYVYQINNSSGANIVLNGAISTATTGTETDLDLGTSATGSYGNVVIGQTVGAGVRLAQLGTKGAFVFNPTNTATTLTDTGLGGYDIVLDTGHTSEASPNVEAAAGNTIVPGGNAIDYDYGQATTGSSSFYIQADSGATLAVGALYDGATAVVVAATSSGTPTLTPTSQTVVLDGAGTGVIYGNDTVRNPLGYNVVSGSNTDYYESTSSLVKDGTGSWAITGNGGGQTQTRGENYQGGTSVADGTFLVMGGTSATNSPTGTGTITVDPTLSADANAKPILGGTGYIAGAVVVNNGGELAPGGAAAGGATTVASITSPIGSVGTLHLNSTLTAASGSIFAFDFNSEGAFNVTNNEGTADNVTSAGLMTLTSVNLTLNDLASGSSTIGAGDYFDLLNYATGSTISFSDYTNDQQFDIGANAYELQIGSTETDLVYEGAAPEPSTRGLLLLAIPGLIFLVRKHKLLRA